MQQQQPCVCKAQEPASQSTDVDLRGGYTTNIPPSLLCIFNKIFRFDDAIDVARVCVMRV